jgi:polysaccharide pyruvyl transferase WcaK-like protein
LREAIAYAFNAGEMETQRSYAMHYARLAPLLLASRVRGGRAIHAGLGIRTATPWRHPIAATLRLCDIVSWRDSYSRSVMGLGTVAPDWAFALGSPDTALTTEWSAQGRSRLAVSLRYNGALPDEAWVRTVRAFAKRRDLEIITVSQIMRDGPLAEELARELGGEAVVWDGPDHATQEERLRSAYRTSRIVLTNRLHAAVIALTEGAIPLGLAASSSDKVPRTLAAAGIAGVTVDSRLAEPAVLENTADDALGRTAPILRQVVEARDALRRLGQEIHGLTA